MSTRNEKVDLWVSFNDDAPTHALSIPTDKCKAFSVNPLKWLRYLGYTIYGQEGYISTTAGGPPVDDYESDIDSTAYYFISEAEPRMLDVDGIDDRTSNASSLSSSRADFRERIKERDGSCIMTGAPDDNCDACHIIPHAKGDVYMANLISHRGENHNVVELDSINDTRNGVLFAVQLHRPFGAAKVAFLQTPNFALTVDDVPYNAAPEESPTTRLTLHHFADIYDPMLLHFTPHNSDARQPEDSSEWPPALIFDFFYGCAALKAWGRITFIESVRKHTKNVYYDDSDADSEELEDREWNGNQVGRGGSIDGMARRTREQAEARNARAAVREDKRRRMDQVATERRVDDIMDVVMALWTRQPSRSRQQQQATHLPEVDHSQDKVNTWLESSK